jgi:hypothetical protein
VKTLYNAELDKKLLIPLKEKFPALFETLAVCLIWHESAFKYFHLFVPVIRRISCAFSGNFLGKSSWLQNIET